MLRMRNRKAAKGFTLVELMIVVAIIGILAAIAIPAMMQYIRRSKTTEATDSLDKIYKSATTYYEETHAARNGAALPKQFPATVAITPAATACNGDDPIENVPAVGEWDNATWQALNFAMSDPYRYQYTFASAGVGEASTFTARANGDLDCDAVLSTFERVGIVGDDGAVQGGAGLFKLNETE